MNISAFYFCWRHAVASKSIVDSDLSMSCAQGTHCDANITTFAVLITYMLPKSQFLPHREHRILPLERTRGYCFQTRSQNCERAAVSFVMSVCPFRTTWFPLDGFSWNFIFMCFSKIYRENSDFIKVWQEYWVLFMKTNIHIWSYLAESVLKWEMFQTVVVEKVKTRILCSVTPPSKPCRILDAEIYSRVRGATDDNMAHAYLTLGT